MPRPFAPVTVPALALQRGETFVRLVELMRRLLEPDGCPWDREQTFESLRRYVLEEACEVIDAIDEGKPEGIREELGDLLLQVVFLGELAQRKAMFGIDDVVHAIVDKLVRRHPHVFADEQVKDSEEVLKNWERIKAAEKKDRPLLASVPRSMPSLVRAQRMGEKVSRVGFDWPDARGSRAKVTEELAELDEAIALGDKKRTEEELGDLLFAIVNLARHVGIDAEGALRATGDKFARRFAHVETRVKETHGGWPQGTEEKPTASVSLEEMDRYWEEAKRAQ